MSELRDDGLHDPSPLRPGPLGRTLALLALAATVLLALATLHPPREATGNAAGFDLGRALADVQVLAEAAHPTGSAAHERVRGHLLEEIRAAGLEPEVQVATAAVGRPPSRVTAARVHNVMARLEGSGDGPAVLLAAHYDTVPGSSGAADDSAGVAALLETMRVLAADGAPQRDVVFLFTDAEEAGLLGARAFVESGGADDVAWMLNFEARGAAGPSFMFETVPGTVPAMRRFAAATPRPVAASYSYDVYRRLPNDTDFSILRRAVPAGYNFAFIHDPAAYHTALDQPERLDPRSLLHHGTHALALARHLAAAPPSAADDGRRAAYFNLPAVGLVVYPVSWEPVLALLAVALLVATLVVGMRRRRLTVGRLLLSLLVLPLGLVAAAALLLTLRWLLLGAVGVSTWDLGSASSVLLSWLLCGAGASALVALLAARRLGALHLAAATAAWWTVLATAAAFALPSSAFLFTWPLLATLAVPLPTVARGAGGGPRWLAALPFAAAVPVLLLWAPTLETLAVALGLREVIVLGALAALVTLLLVLPLCQLATRRFSLWPAAAVLAAGLVVLLAGVLGAGQSPERPRPNSLVYALDGTTGEAVWASFDPQPDDWTGQVLENPERRSLDTFFGPRELLVAPASPLELEPPVVDVVDRRATPDGGHRLELRLRSPRGAAVMVVSVEPRGGLEAAHLDGRHLEGLTPPFALTYHGVPEDGFPLVLELTGGEPVDLSLIDRTYALPSPLAPTPRPSDLQPHPYRPSDLTMVAAEHTIDPTKTPRDEGAAENGDEPVDGD